MSICSNSTTMASVKKVLKKHLEYVKYPRDSTNYDLKEKGANFCKRRIRRELGRLTVGKKTPFFWKLAICRHVAEFILRGAMNGDSCKEITNQLVNMGVQISFEHVQTFLNSALEQGEKEYTDLLFRSLFVGIKKKPGPKQDLRNKLIGYLAWTEKGDQSLFIESWRNWPLHEVSFYILTGIIPPNRYRNNKGTGKQGNQLTGWNNHDNTDWFKKVNVTVRHSKQSDISECIEIERLLDENPRYVNQYLGELKIRTSDDYIRRILQYNGYQWYTSRKIKFQFIWNYNEDKDKSKKSLLKP